MAKVPSNCTCLRKSGTKPSSASKYADNPTVLVGLLTLFANNLSAMREFAILRSKSLSLALGNLATLLFPAETVSAVGYPER